MYFDENESKLHKEAKEKLFDLITQKRIRILDQNGIEYKIFAGENKNEFLHIESFVMNYSRDALFSSSNSPCIKHLESFNTNGMCDTKGYYGAFKELPCKNCVIMNFRKYIEGASKYASYRPDIAFGYGGIHKIWLEIKNESPCSKNKIEFCKENDVVLLEIDADTILKFKDHNGKLVFNKLEEYVYERNIYDESKFLFEYIEDKMNGKDYLLDEEVEEINKFKIGIIKELNLNTKDIVKFIRLLDEKIDSKYKYIIIEGKELKSYFGVKRKSSALAKNEVYHNLIKIGLIEEREDRNKITMRIVESSNDNRIAKCAKCKNKENTRDMVKIVVSKNKKDYVKYYHDRCTTGLPIINKQK